MDYTRRDEGGEWQIHAGGHVTLCNGGSYTMVEHAADQQESRDQCGR